MSIVITLTLGAAAAVFIGLGIPLLRGKVGPNALYGFRVPATLKDERLWYEVNQRCGQDSLVIGLGVIAILAAGLAGLAAERSIGIAATAWVLLGSAWALARGLVFIRRWRRGTPPRTR